MLNDKVIRLVFAMLFVAAILIYEGLGWLLTLLPLSIEITKNTFMSIAKYLGSLSIIIVSLKWKPVIELAGFHFIGDDYKGSSKMYKQAEDGRPIEVLEDQTIEFSIRQSLLTTSISGVSRENREGMEKKMNSTWTGKLVMVEDLTYTFLVELVSGRRTYSAVFKLFINKGKVDGFISYSEGDKHYFKEIVYAEKVK